MLGLKRRLRLGWLRKGTRRGIVAAVVETSKAAAAVFAVSFATNTATDSLALPTILHLLASLL
jgi:hypothetical protein